jgi:CRISPR-associated endoribonuclease Cas6
VAVVLQEIANGLLREGRVRLGEVFLEVREVKVRDTVVRTREITVRMLSPVVAYSTVPVGTGSYTYYYSPFEPRFRELILANLAKKYLLVFGRPADETGFEIAPERVGPADLKIVNYKDTVIKGWMGTYRLTGDPQLLEIALSAGLGAKNSQGFGCCEIRGE